MDSGCTDREIAAVLTEVVLAENKAARAAAQPPAGKTDPVPKKESAVSAEVVPKLDTATERATKEVADWLNESKEERRDHRWRNPNKWKGGKAAHGRQWKKLEGKPAPNVKGPQPAPQKVENLPVVQPEQEKTTPAMAESGREQEHEKSPLHSAPPPGLTYNQVLKMDKENEEAPRLEEALHVVSSYKALVAALPVKPQFGDMRIMTRQLVVKELAAEERRSYVEDLLSRGGFNLELPAEVRTNSDSESLFREVELAVKELRDYEEQEVRLRDASLKWVAPEETSPDVTLELDIPAEILVRSQARALMDRFSESFSRPSQMGWSGPLQMLAMFLVAGIKLLYTALVLWWSWDHENFLKFCWDAAVMLFAAQVSMFIAARVWALVCYTLSRKRVASYYRLHKRLNAPCLNTLPRLNGHGPTRCEGLEWLKFPMAMSEDGYLPVGLCNYLSANLTGITKEATALAQVPGLVTTWCKEHKVSDVLYTQYRLMATTMLGPVREV